MHADTRLVLAVGRPLPINRNYCTAFTESGIDSVWGNATVLADDGYQGTGPSSRTVARLARTGSKAGRTIPTTHTAGCAAALSTPSPARTTG
ncbi:hypothetical protein [Streptomyces sp. NBC_01727]|uniref:hypothetical protein n=1 Tax=Streptomyces sp. NBC_01727 TaxID=2975924 RepID=UPI002E117275|nr:hypothetical protein OIE76_42325 [Streptomyces sp. NBC_01727]